ncbi:glyoxalase [Gordonia sp. zg691]|uniref:Glyoxalase n=1 Tax=Gordonia jinghuaiqii TaxID=2758710 RepID=A0A7D7QZR3_9ACTN|nr:VOC family protein [Gordonia jinghuaiqii]MBD0860562.1 glyoxalase [Gordonia jinghuaiqii]MCR5978173.1 glyoxalase [Gordonia jinghuaiqii]QMT01371.1 glyoxalase [Gordonia jinghuaiqii]
MTPMLFINLPVADVSRSRRFFGVLGFRFDEMFCDDGAACMIVNDSAVVVLMQRRRFAGYAAGNVAEPTRGRESLLAFSADSRAQTDRLADAALASGGSALRNAEDLGFMYCRSFCDPDGHAWEVVWMDPSQIPQDGD